jgi:hypothetical protein
MRRNSQLYLLNPLYPIEVSLHAVSVTPDVPECYRQQMLSEERFPTGLSRLSKEW